MRYFVGLVLLSLVGLSFGQDRIVVFIEDQNIQDNKYLSLDYSDFTDIVFAFANPDGSGGLSFRYSTSNIQNFIDYAHDRGVRVHLSFGGAANKDNGWVGNVGTHRTAFVDRIGQYVAAWDLDGINLDWEFPANGYATNYGLLASALKTKLNSLESSEGRNLELTCAVAPLQWNNGGINSTFLNSMDYVYVMAFDDGTCTTCGGPNHSSLTMATNAFNYWQNTKGVPAAKIVIAIPFYSNTKARYENFSASNPSGYYNDADGSFGGQYYNSMPLIEDKIDMVTNKGGAGIFVWEVTQDRSDEYSLLNGIASYMGDALNCPGPNLGSTVDLCEETSATLDAGVTKTGASFTWLKDNVEIETAVGQSYTVTQSGTYKVSVSIPGCDVQTSQVNITSSLLTYTGDDEICEQGQSTFNIGNHDGATVSWFTTESGGSSFNTGTSYTIPMLASDVTYYLEAEASVGANCQGVAEWSSGTTYAAGGTRVIYSGSLYSNGWWTQGDIPTSGGPWSLVEACGGVACARTPIEITVNNCVDGLTDVESSNHITVYPNPAENFLQIETEYTLEHVELYNAMGVPVLDFSLEENQINLGETLTDGIYFTRIYTDRGIFIHEFSKR